ncbi:MAG: 7-carboxy-7-deazaguanine synthase QueE [Bacteroidia bacterium]
MSGLSQEQQSLLDSGQILPVMEDFYTIQGEGFNTGKAAYFIRLGGCDVGCHWCDVKESWDAAIHPLTHIETIVERASEFPAKAVVITGGEPSLYDLAPLCALLKENGIKIFIETSGAYPLTGTFDWVCVSPKKFKAPGSDWLAAADELKVIVFNSSDLKWAEDHALKIKSDCKRYLQPEWSKSEKMLPEIIEYVKTHPHWEVSLQTHKYMHIP